MCDGVRNVSSKSANAATIAVLTTCTGVTNVEDVEQTKQKQTRASCDDMIGGRCRNDSGSHHPTPLKPQYRTSFS